MNNSIPQAVQRLIAATDLSPASDIAVEQAALLAKEWNLELVLLHVFNDGFWATIKALYEAERWAVNEPVLVARNRLSQQTSELAQRHGIRVRGETRTGRAASEIAAFGREQDAQLLVVGEHGEDWIGDFVVGGTALKVLKRAELPVLLARCPARADFANIIVATDFSDNATRAAQLALHWFPRARMQLVHAYFVAFEGRMRMAGASSEDIERYRADECSRAEQKVEAQLTAVHAKASVGKLLRLGSPATVLNEQAERLGADLIVIGKHGGTAWDERLLGSVTQNVLYHVGCNVLLVP
ncbi:MAG: universal stress protein [Sterolibacteriaceae bacterium]|uniref:Universal stress protein n=1 Tax=Candidatus Methylophosphatis roskildensis TaxID=2899263 RepID=A0A9D7E4E2_9PROT|nr:universal stress protein [Candidatus Methylophosphatis roskildensis]